MLRLVKHLAGRKTVTQPGTIVMFRTAHTWKRGEPEQQEYFTFQNGLWHPIETQGAAVPQGVGVETPKSFQFSVLSWNIDFMRPQNDARMTAALKHLGSLISKTPQPSVIMLNEMTKSDLSLIKLADWVRAGYNITDASTDRWESPSYGTCILIPRNLPIKSVFRLHYERTSMQRDALFVDVAVSPRHQVLRLCTSHLESFRASPPKRPAQLAAAAEYLRRAHAGILGGDLNAIEEFDRTLHVQNGLKDAYLESGGVEGDEGGMTWGQMACRTERERFGLSRMDKLLFCGGVRLVGFERFGMDVVVEDEAAAKELLDALDVEKPWVTDHLGVRAEFRVEVPEMASGEGTNRGETTTQSPEVGSRGPTRQSSI